MKLSNYQTEIKLGLVLSLVALAIPELASATTIDFGSGQSAFASSQLSAGPIFATAVAYVAGTIFAFAGILKLKQHAENPAQVPMSHGLARLVAGGALLSLPTITSLIQGTLASGIGTSAAAQVQTIAPGLQ
jgi:hypothetical protein